MMAYLTMMSSRLVELRRVLKPTGSLYLHCDPTASHYLKLLCDAIFGKERFLAEIIWKRSSAHNDAKQGRKQPGRIHDIILLYSKTDEWTWNWLYTAYDEEYTDSFYKHIEPETGRRYRLGDITAPGGADPAKRNPRYEFLGVTRYWRYSKERMQELYQQGRIIQTKPGAVPAYKRYLDEMKGVSLQDLWTDITPIPAQAKERLGYPTQKPVALLERIILASSNPGGLVLDPFCGCGTTIDAAEKNGRDWIGIDVTQLAISLIKNRLQDTYGSRLKFVSGTPSESSRSRREEALTSKSEINQSLVTSTPTEQAESIVRIIGEPTTPNEAATLAEQDKYQFQWWALGLVGARPVEQKKGADHGIDGKILFRDDPKAAKPEQIIIQVKGGKTGVKDVRDLRGVLDREKAAIGILISLQPVTGPMETEAASAGFYEHKTNQQKYPRLQLRTVKELMEGKGIERPSTVAATDETFKKAPESKKKHGEQKALEL
jgi:DNA modification methylase